MARTDDVNIRLRLLGARDLVRGSTMASRSISGMERKIEKTGASSVLMAQGLESGRRGLRALGTAVKYTAFALGGLAVVEIPRALNAFREAEKADRNVEAAIKSTGGVAKVTAKDIGALSERMMLKTGIDDEEIKNAAAMLLTFKEIRNAGGENNKVFDQTLQTTADMAARFGSDMPNAAKQLAKALNDPAQALSALRRSGVSFTDEQTDMINAWWESGEKLRAQKYILQELSEQTAGAAVSQADSVDIMKTKWGELEEQIGAGLFPLFEDLADLAGEVVDEVSAILGNRKLTGEQKFDRVMDIIDERIAEGIDKLDDYLPKIAEAGAQLGGRFAVSLGRAFLNSNFWGKLFIGAWLWKILFGAQGTKVLLALGSYMAKRLGRSLLRVLAPTVAAGMAASSAFGQILATKFGALGKVSGKWFGRGLLVGIVIGLPILAVELAKKLPESTKSAIWQWGRNAAQNFVNALIKGINWGIDRINDAFDAANILGKLGVDAPEIGRIGEVDFGEGRVQGGGAGRPPAPGFNPKIPHGTGLPPSAVGKGGGGKGGRRRELSAFTPRRIEVPVYLNGRQIALAVADEASNAAALR